MAQIYVNKLPDDVIFGMTSYVIVKFHSFIVLLVLIKSWTLIKSWIFNSCEFIPKHTTRMRYNSIRYLTKNS